MEKIMSARERIAKIKKTDMPLIESLSEAVIKEVTEAALALAEEDGITVTELSRKISRSKSYIRNIITRDGYNGATNLVWRLTRYIDAKAKGLMPQ